MQSLPNADKVLRPLAEEFFRQLQLCGQLALPGRADPTKNKRLMHRIQTISKFIRLLESCANLTAQRRKRRFCCITRDIGHQQLRRLAGSSLA